MKLNAIPARHGVLWVKMGITTFLRQPLALSGLFFIFMAVMSVLSLVPVLGSVLALTLLPGATLGLMAATQEALKGKFPMPGVLFSGFRAGRKQLRAILVLGVLYASGFVLLLGISALVDGGKFAQLYLIGGAIGAETVADSNFELAALVAMAMYLPLSLMFWHAPALVHWHGITPVKSMFFSIVACSRNFGAFAVYGLVWVAVFVLVGTTIALLASLSGSEDLVAAILLPCAMVMAAMFFTSIYFSFTDTFGATVEHLA